MIATSTQIDFQPEQHEIDFTKPATEEAKKMEGAYVGFQPKPAVEVILVVSKGKTLTWLDDCRIPYQSEDDKASLIEKNPHTVMAKNDIYGDHTMCKRSLEHTRKRKIPRQPPSK